jgi:hypothetical protein
LATATRAAFIEECRMILMNATNFTGIPGYGAHRIGGRGKRAHYRLYVPLVASG